MRLSRLVLATVLPAMLAVSGPMLRWVSLVSGWAWFIAFVYAIGHLFFGRLPKPGNRFLSATIAALPLLIALSVAFTRDPADFLPKAGFYVAITVVPDYSKWCQPVRFIKPTGPQELGLCPAESYDTLPIFVKVIYDTSGEIMWAPGARTESWKDAMSHIMQPWQRAGVRTPDFGEPLIKQQRQVAHLWGPYYIITMGIAELG